EPGALVLETKTVAAFLDHRPLFPGHCLVIPREHVETVIDLPAPLTAPLWDAVRALARAVEGALGADGSFVAINNRVSQSVPHLHVHVVPRRRGDGLRGFFWPRGRYASPEEMEETRRRIAEAVESPGTV
ncbi:MAG: HIT family protein, partial [Candidatus Rokuibacteriota bacterium]